MLVYPQLTSGALAHFPVQKRRRMRTIVNVLADSTAIKLADPQGEITEWQLEYTGLSDDEVTALLQYFAATEGRLNIFTFLDPTANLFAWSDQLANAAWNKGPLLAVTGGVADPIGGTSAWHLSNSGAGPQSISQTLQAPGGYMYCSSVYGRCPLATTVTLLRGSDRADRTLGTDWNRITFSGHGDATAQSVEFGVEVPAGGSMDIFGLQVEPQASASVYKPSTQGGVYPNAYFRDDVLSFTATDVNRHSATINITHANRL
jgi:hypothetical protein